MEGVAVHPWSGLGDCGTTPRRGSESTGSLWGVIRLGLGLGTGSQDVWIEERRVEPTPAPATMDDVSPGAVALLRNLRQISGLTWEELAIALTVSKRALHLWDNGQPVSQRHLKQLHRVAGMVRRLDQGNPVHLRHLLLKDLGGRNALTLLREGEFDQAERRLAAEQPIPRFAELPAGEFWKRIPGGVPLAGYSDVPEVQLNRERPLRVPKIPNLRKG